MKQWTDLTKKEILQLPQLDWSWESVEVDELLIFPTRRKHDSGFACFVSAVRIDKDWFLLGQYHDVIYPQTKDFGDINPRLCGMDASLHGIIRWCHQAHKITIHHRLSDLCVEPKEDTQ